MSREHVDHTDTANFDGASETAFADDRLAGHGCYCTDHDRRTVRMMIIRKV